MSLSKWSIGRVSEYFDVSVHTLRYYEKIGVLPPINKDGAGRRVYSDSDIQRLGFIKRAQRMRFSLKEIRLLIDLDKTMARQKPRVQELVREKLEDIDKSLTDLNLLKHDLNTMLDACKNSNVDDDCPIIEGLKPSKSDFVL